MKVAYIIKKGLQCYPPCLAQVLYLNDLGIDLTVYHGLNSEHINKLLDSRNIEHHTMSFDKQSRNKIQSVMNFMGYTKEIKKIFKSLPKDMFIWFGNCESAIAFNNHDLAGRKYLITLLELYNFKGYYHSKLKRIINGASAVICCEKHRAAIVQSAYKLKKTPYIIPNKPYDLSMDISSHHAEKLKKYKGGKLVIYQGIIGPDRPLDKIAEAISLYKQEKIYFLVMGRCSEEYKNLLSKKYSNTVFLGYIPAPEHLSVTEKCHIGIANYDFNCLNNIFCAPNKIYEYAKFGIPMLCSQNIGLTETVGSSNSGECVDFNDVQSIYKGLKSILNNYTEYSANAKQFYESTDNCAIMEKIIEDLSLS